ncbi:EAL domain-containing protein [Aquincola sp. S2]|uniref:EAL domain-containing protein n=1 Tax=Pseudaquabacterium terrae TaxID=2732868 RepID=A0ABX2EG07_9BURK|nr:EAL domain-containing protein [Aquabacterium terrae]
MLENSPDIIVRYDLELRRIYANPRYEELNGLKPEQYLGMRLSEVSRIGSLAQRLEQRMRLAIETGQLQELDFEWRAVDGRMLWHNVRITVERDAQGRPASLLTIARDITARKRAEQALATREREFRSLAETSPDFIMRYDAEARTRYANPAVLARLGRPAEWFVGRTPCDSALPGHETAMVEYERVLRQVLADGEPAEMELMVPAPGASGGTETHHVRIVAVKTEDGCIDGALALGRDITQGVEQRERIRALALSDPLTRLHNRQALYDYAPGLIAEARRHHRRLGVMILDIDRFKDVNDTLGHPAGDQLLREVAQRVAGCTRGYDLLVRLGGDEFAIVATNLEHDMDMASIAEKIERALFAPLQLGGRQVVVSASIGIALFPADGEQLEDLMAHADAAMYHAKRGGHSGYAFYRSEFSERAHERMALEQALRGAQAGAGLELHYQPLVALDDERRIVGAEALLRWRHPELGLLAPDRFIAIAEDTGLIVPIGRWVIDQVAQAARRWNEGRAEPLRIAFNVSTRQFLRDDLVAAVREALQRHDCRAQWLAMEVTEGLLLEDSDSVRRALHGLSELGLEIAIDDFGTGYSALGYLSKFDVHCLKIDRLFVRDIEAEARQAELVKAFFAIARALGLRVVAEGVETEGQAAFLRAHGCGVAQGFLFCRPVPVPVFEQLLRRGAPETDRPQPAGP